MQHVAGERSALMISHTKSGRPLVVGVGASAGGLEALQAFFGAIPPGNGLTFVVVSHLDPNSKTFLPEILAKSTKLNVEEVKDAQSVKADTIYVAPGHSVVSISGGVIHLTPAPRREDRRAPIDRFFQSLARDQNTRSVAVVLSGAGSDGALGLKAVSDSGGLTFVQEPSTARHHGMPQSALDSGVADYSLAPEEMAQELLAHARHLAVIDGEDESAAREEVEAVLPEICERLLRVSGHNFSHYKPSTLTRRILRRIQVLRVPSARQYVERLDSDPAEPDNLFKEFLINVTSFFRDLEAFDVLAREILPKFFKNIQEADSVRIWVPGCSTGEEAYTLAILLKEQMDGMAVPPEVQIFATDIDEEALAIARQGTYPLSIAEQLSPERLARFFTKKGQQYQIVKEVRDLVLFSVHNLTNDPPFSKLDLISCRNLLIYLGNYLQKKLIPLFHYALKPGGHLFLGPSENLNSYRDLFRTVDAKHRISVRLPTNGRPSGLLSGRSGPLSAARVPVMPASTDVDAYFLMERNTLQKYAPKTVVVDEDGHLVCTSGNLDKYLSVSAGAYYNSVIRLAREGLRMGLRSALAEAIKTGGKVVRDGLSLKTAEGVQRVAITVEPLPLSGSESGLYFIAFQDAGPPLALGDATRGPTAEDAANIIEQLERELASTRQDLERTVQDLEAANEELKSGNEELLSMNEELQSANEELETSKEEVQAANDGLSRANTDLENLLSSTQIATIFLDSEGYLRGVTSAVNEIYNLRPADAGRPLADFTHRARAMPEMPSFDEVCGSHGPLEAEVEMQNGAWFVRRVLPYRTSQGAPEGIVVTFIDITARRKSEEALKASEARFRQLADSMPQIVWTAAADGQFDYFNKRWYEFTGVDPGQNENEFWASIHHPDDVTTYKVRWEQSVATGEPFEVESRFIDRHSGLYRWHLGRALPVRDRVGRIAKWYGTSTDIDDQKRIEGELRASEERFRLTADYAPVFIWLANTSSKERDWFNKPWIEFVGRPMEMLVGLGWTDDLHPEDADRVLIEVGAATHARRSFAITYRLRRSDNQFRWVLDNGLPRFLPDGEFVGYIGSCIDITEQKQAEEALREADGRKDEFLATLAHELRNPLAPIRSGLRILRQADDDEAAETRDMMDRQLSHMVRLIDDLMDISRISSGKITLRKARVALRSVSEHALDSSRPLIDGGRHTLHLRLSQDPVWVNADLTRISQVVSNLLANAAKYTPEGGRITLATYRERDQAVIQVSDNGVGIPPDMLSEIFRMFMQVNRTLDRSRGGLGIGLALVDKIVELHGGTIRAESAGPGLGSTFTIRLPLADEQSLDAEVRSPDAKAPHPRASLRVLVVDDNVDAAMTLANLFKFTGHATRVAFSGPEALEIAKDFLPDVVFLDIGLPKMNGLEVARRLQTEVGLTSTTLIAVTGWGSEEDKRKTREAGFHHHLTKPVEVEHVESILEGISSTR